MKNLCSKCEPYETEYIKECKKINCMYKQHWDDKFGIMEKEKEIGKVVDGVGKDAPIITNERGGKQAKAPMAMHLLDPEYLKEFYKNEKDEKDSDTLSVDEAFNQKVRQAIAYIAEFMETEEKYLLLIAMDELAEKEQQIIKVAKTLQEGIKNYPTNNWRLIPQEEHINHALIHLVAHLAGDKQDNHIEHALARLMMAYATESSENFSYTRYMEENDEVAHFKHLYKLSGKCFFDEANICHYFDDFVKTRNALEEIRKEANRLLYEENPIYGYNNSNYFELLAKYVLAKTEEVLK